MKKSVERYRECQVCVNSNRNPSVIIHKNGLCDICARYKKYFRKSVLKEEFKFFASRIKRGKKKYDVLVGISGGKDSTAVLQQLKKRGFRILAFTFDVGYYPTDIFSRAKSTAQLLGISHKKINIKKYIRPIDRASFKLTADLYDEKPSRALREKFRQLYKEGRKHYSVKCNHVLPFVRTCQLCRRIVIRAYYKEATKHGVDMIVLGMNEWAHLSKQNTSSCAFRAIRALKPYAHKPPVYIVHSPFLFQRRAKDTQKILRKINWPLPHQERFVETNSNSCLFARAAEMKAKTMLGFHPDSTRLSREITAGFITKKQAKRALSKIHRSRYSVRQILKRAEII